MLLRVAPVGERLLGILQIGKRRSIGRTVAAASRLIGAKHEAAFAYRTINHRNSTVRAIS